MPSYVFTGPYPTTYPETRDANSRPLGIVEPGDILIFDEPPADGMWVPEIPPRGGGGDGQDPGTGGDAGEPQDETPQDPPGPVPAPPAVIPGT